MNSKLYVLLFLAVTNASLANARDINKAAGNGASWSNSSTWSQGRLPQNGDSVVIPANNTVYLDIPVSLNNVSITVYGSLVISKHIAATLDNNSVLTIGNGGMLTASFFSPQEVISIGGVNKFVAKNDVAIAGIAYANSQTGVSPAGFSSTPLMLPVTFTSFTATRSADAAVSITWNTVNEVNNSHFEIERSADGSDWTSIATLAAGNNLSANEYSYTDATAPAGQSWYRIRQVDIDGKYTYSKTVLVAASANANAQATIIASGRTITILPEKLSGSRLMVRVITINGQVLQQQSFDAASSRIDLAVSTTLPGIYVVQLTDGSQWSLVKKVML